MPVMDLWTRAAAGWSLGTPARRAARLSAFAAAERGSQLDMLAAAAACTDVARAADYLRHAHDEQRHARAFANRARELGGSGWIHADGGALFTALGEERFLAFVHQGEDRARRRFVVLQKALVRRGDARSAAVFTAVLPDEDRHAAYTLDALRAVSPDPRRALRRAWRWDAWQSWQRLAARTTRLLHDAGTWCLYWTLAPLALWIRWTRPGRTGWV